MERCREVWPAAPSQRRPELHCEMFEHDDGVYHFDGRYEVVWAHVDRKRRFVGRDPFKPRRRR